MIIVCSLARAQAQCALRNVRILYTFSVSATVHVTKVRAKIAKANYMINRVKKILPLSALKILYNSLIQPHVNYGLIVWGGSVHIGTVTKALKKSIRIINNVGYNYHTEPLFKSCEILQVVDQYNLQSSIFMYRLKEGGQEVFWRK